MYKLCKTEQSAARQRQLEAGLLSAMAVRRYEDISVSDLCDQLSIPRKSFYRYFASKDGALQALLDHTLMNFESFSSDYRSREKRSLQKDLEQFFAFWLAQRPLLDVLQRSDLSGQLIERAVVYAQSDTAMPRRFLPEDGKSVQEQVVAFTVCGLMSLILNWHRAGYPQSVEEMGRLAVRLVSQPLFPNAGNLL